MPQTVVSRNPMTGKAKILMIVIVAVLVGGGGAYFLLGQKSAQANGASGAAASNKKMSKATETQHVPLEIYEIGSFLVNVKSTDDLRYLKVQVAAGLRYFGDGEEGESKEDHGGKKGSKEELWALPSKDSAIARDCVVQVFSDMTFGELRTPNGREEAKRRIKEALDEKLDDADVDDVLFLSFVMQ